MTDGPPLALSMGDPAGVGPELAIAAWSRRHDEALPAFVVIGSHAVIAAAGLRVSVPVVAVSSPSEAVALFDTALPVIDIGVGSYTPGQPDDAGAVLALTSLTLATTLTR